MAGTLYLTHALGFNLPPYWLTRPVAVYGQEDHDHVEKSDYLGNLYQAPLGVKWEDESEWWQLPLDPVISVSGKNIIVRRNVLKAADEQLGYRGSIKEAWSQDDYEISIAGALVGKGGLPEKELRKLRRYCEARKTLMVKNELLTLFNITRIAVEEYALPFTKGVENQMYTIKGYADDAFELLVKE
jgi:hypothetical protein